MWIGPQPQGRAARLQVVDRIVADLHRSHGESIKAIGLYGSLSRGTDGDFSDVELWCVVSEPGLDKLVEWVYGPSKAEVDMYGEDVMLASAVEVDSMWSLKQGAIINCRPLYGDLAYFTHLRELVMSPPKKVFDEVIAEMVVGEFFEWMGKIRNGVARNDLTFLPITTINFTLHMALMAALLHRHIYSTTSTLMKEALALPTLPEGYAELAGMVTAGNLHDKA
jgi:kanamycin nucleotidyltransferase